MICVDDHSRNRWIELEPDAASGQGSAILYRYDPEAYRLRWAAIESQMLAQKEAGAALGGEERAMARALATIGTLCRGWRNFATFEGPIPDYDEAIDGVIQPSSEAEVWGARVVSHPVVALAVMKIMRDQDAAFVAQVNAILGEARPTESAPSEVAATDPDSSAGSTGNPVTAVM